MVQDFVHPQYVWYWLQTDGFYMVYTKPFVGRHDTLKKGRVFGVGMAKLNEGQLPKDFLRQVLERLSLTPPYSKHAAFFQGIMSTLF